MGRGYGVAGAILAFLAVAAGAFGAHGLKDHLAADLLAVFETAVRYQLIHALALVALFGLSPSGPLRWAGAFFVLGIVLFSGSLYLLALTGLRWLGAITPFGGVLFLAGWAAAAVGIAQRAATSVD